MKLTWFGHSTYGLEFGNSKVIIDPFFTGNPSAEGLNVQAAQADLTHIVLTHGHGDHLGDTLEIAKRTGAKVVANYEICMWLAKKGLENMDPGNTGGTLIQEGFSVTFVQAHHSSAFLDDDGVSHHLGHPNGVVMHIDNEKTLYHMGDTDIFGDMALIEELHQPVIGIVPVGDRFTMGGAVAALACRRYFNFETIIPCHYGTFPIIEATADKFVDGMEDDAGKVSVMELGQTLQL